VKLGVEGVDAADRAKVLMAKGSHWEKLLYRIDLHLRDLARKDLIVMAALYNSKCRIVPVTT